MVNTEDVIKLYNRLMANGIQVWLSGGWGIDALLGEQTRAHKDLDVIMLMDDVVRLREILGYDGYVLKELWSENRWTIDAQGVETATAFVLDDGEGRQVDAHALRIDNQGNGIPAWVEEHGFIFTKQDLAGEGMIGGLAVRCLSAESQVICHTGYELPEKQVGDLERLHEKFGV